MTDLRPKRPNPTIECCEPHISMWWLVGYVALFVIAGLAKWAGV